MATRLGEQRPGYRRRVPDEQEKSESVDADRIDPLERGDDEVLGSYPPDQLLGANQYGVVPSEEEGDEPPDERVSREEPEPLLEALEHPDRHGFDDREPGDRLARPRGPPPQRRQRPRPVMRR